MLMLEQLQNWFEKLRKKEIKNTRTVKSLIKNLNKIQNLTKTEIKTLKTQYFGQTGFKDMVAIETSIHLTRKWGNQNVFW